MAFIKKGVVIVWPAGLNMENANPVIFQSISARPLCPEDQIDSVHDDIDSREVFGK